MGSERPEPGSALQKEVPLNPLRAWLLVAAVTGLAGCAPGLRQPVSQGSEGGWLDLQAWNFESRGPVIPQDWLWDAGVLWSPVEGRPALLPPARDLGAPDRGGSLPLDWNSRLPRIPVAATAHLTVLVDGGEGYALQIGAFPGAVTVWVNGVKVSESGVLSLDPVRFRSDGAGKVLTVQPRDGVLSLVVELVTSDPLVRHPELNRVWSLGPADAMMSGDRVETGWRSVQAAFLALALVVFSFLACVLRDRGALFVFVAFLAVCFIKLVANVEQPEPLLASVLPGVPLSWYLLINHGLNLCPYPLFVLFLNRQFPEEIPGWAALLLTGTTVAATAWELLPFIALESGRPDLYQQVLGLSWSFVLNVYVVAVTLYLFERFYQLYARQRPLSRGLFFGGMLLGLIVLIPIPLSGFVTVKYIYFLGWGLTFYLLILCVDLIRLQIQTAKDELRRLDERAAGRDALARFLAPAWAGWLGRGSVETIRPGDRRSTEAVLVQIHAPAGERSLPLVGRAAATRRAVLVDWREGEGVWAMDAWSEVALEFSLEVQRDFSAAGILPVRIALTRASVSFQVLDLDPHWHPVVSGLPMARLAELDGVAERYGATVVLDHNLKDGLVVGGWRRHRHLTMAGTEIELYEGEEETLAALKDGTLDAFEEGLSHARHGDLEAATRSLVTVVRRNPFDEAARVHLASWGHPAPPQDETPVKPSGTAASPRPR